MIRLNGKRAAVLAPLGLALFVACGGPTPPPQPTPSPSPGGSPATSPVPGQSAMPTTSGAPGPSPSFAVGPGGLGELPPQPSLPGLYLPAGVLAQGTDHFAMVQARLDCQTLTGVLSAGQWTLVDRGAIVMPTLDPAQPTPAVALPEFTLPDWLLLRWGDEYAIARVGGDENGCLAQVWRLAHVDYAASGAINSTGQANALPIRCAAAGGIAELSAFYIGADGTFFSLETTVPLLVGSHPINLDSELGAAAVGPTVEMAFPLLFGGVSEDEQTRFDVEPYFPEDPAAGWPGTIEVTSLDPLIGTITFDGVRNESGELLTLTAPFRCDLPSHQLARAADEAANATPSPQPSPSPAPGNLVVNIASGPHAGPHQVTSPDLTCSLGLFGPGDWTASYGAAEPVAGEVQSLTVTAHANGDADVLLMLGDDLENDWFNTRDDTQAEVTDHGASVDIAVSGHAANSDFTIDITCYDISRF